MKQTIEELLAIVSQKGGKFAPSKYKNRHEKLEWECSNGHTWQAAPSAIIKGRWCPACRD